MRVSGVLLYMNYDAWGLYVFFFHSRHASVMPMFRSKQVSLLSGNVSRKFWSLRSSEKSPQMAYFGGLPSYYIKYVRVVLSSEIRDSLVCTDFVTIVLRISCSHLTHSSTHIIQYDCHHRYSTRSLAFISEGFFFSQRRENLCYLSHFICSADKGVTFL